MPGFGGCLWYGSLDGPSFNLSSELCLCSLSLYLINAYTCLSISSYNFVYYLIVLKGSKNIINTHHGSFCLYYCLALLYSKKIYFRAAFDNCLGIFILKSILT